MKGTPWRNRYTSSGILAILLWSTTIAVMRSLSEQVGPFMAGAAVFLLGGAFTLAARMIRGGSLGDYSSLPRRYLVGCGLLFVLYMLTMCSAVGLAANRDQVLGVALINYLWPTLTIVFSLLVQRMRARILLIPAMAAALVGVFLVLAQDGALSWAFVCENLASNPVPYSLALVAAVSWGLYSALAGHWADPRKGGAVPIFLLASGLVLLAIRFGAGGGPWSPRAAAEALFLGSATGSAYVLWDSSMRRGDVVFVASCSYFTPLLSTCISCAYLGVSAGANLWWGCGLIIAGAVLSKRSIRAPTTAGRDGRGPAASTGHP